MPLKLDLKCGEKMIINGAVIENVGPHAKVLMHNRAAILREKEILTEQDAATPASRVYFSLQCAYMFPESREAHLKRFRQFLDDYVDACPSAAAIGDEIRGHVEEGDYYKGLKETRNLIAHEMKTLDTFREGMAKLAAMAAEAEAEASDKGGGTTAPVKTLAKARTKA